MGHHSVICFTAWGCCRVSPRRASHFHLSPNESNQSKGLEYNTIRFVLARCGQHGHAAAHRPLIGIVALPLHSTRSLRIASPCTRDSRVVQAMRSELGGEERSTIPIKVELQPKQPCCPQRARTNRMVFGLKALCFGYFHLRSNESDSPGRAKPACTAQRPPSAPRHLNFIDDRAPRLRTGLAGDPHAEHSRQRRAAEGVAGAAG